MRRAHTDAYTAGAWKNPFYTPRNEDSTSDDRGIGAEASSTPAPSELFHKFRTFKGYFVQRLAEVKQLGRYQQDPDEVEEIEYFLGVMSDMQAEETHGAEGIEQFISRIYEMVRKNPLPVNVPLKDGDGGGGSSSTSRSQNENPSTGGTSGNLTTESQKVAGKDFNYFATVEESFKDPPQRGTGTEWGCGGGDDLTFARRSSDGAESRQFRTSNPISPRDNLKEPSLQPFGRGCGRGPAYNVPPPGPFRSRPSQRRVPPSDGEVGPVPPPRIVPPPPAASPRQPQIPKVDDDNVSSVGSVYSFRDADGKEQLFERRAQRAVDIDLPNLNEEMGPPLRPNQPACGEEDCDDTRSQVSDINSHWEDYVSTSRDGSMISSGVYGKFRDVNPSLPQIFPTSDLNPYTSSYITFQGLAGRDKDNVYRPGVIPNPFFRGRFVNPVPAHCMEGMVPSVNARASDQTEYIHPNLDDDSWNTDSNVSGFEDNTGNGLRDNLNFTPVVEPRPVDFKEMARQKAQECFLRNRKRRQRIIPPEDNTLSSLDPRAGSTRYQQERLNKMNPCGGGPRIRTNPNVPNAYQIHGKDPVKPWHRQQGWSNPKNRNAAFSNMIQRPKTKGNTILGNYSSVKPTVDKEKGTRRAKRKEAVGTVKKLSKAQQIKNQIENEGFFVLGKKQVIKEPKEPATVDENSKSESSSSVVSSRVSSSNGQEHPDSRSKTGKRKAHSSRNSVSDSEETACSTGVRKTLNKKSKLTKNKGTKESEIPLTGDNMISTGMRRFRIPKLNKKVPDSPSSTSSSDVETPSEIENSIQNASRRVNRILNKHGKQTGRKSTGKESVNRSKKSSADQSLRNLGNRTSRKSTSGGRKNGTEGSQGLNCASNALRTENKPDWTDSELNDPVYLCMPVLANEESDNVSIANSDLSTANNPGGTFKDNLDPVSRKSKTKKRHPPATRAQSTSIANKTGPLQTSEVIESSKFIGSNDLVTNQGLVKIKMECDYIPPVTVKVEPGAQEVDPDVDLYLKGVLETLQDFQDSEPVQHPVDEEYISQNISPVHVFNFTMPSFSSDEEEDRALDNIENLVLDIQPDDGVHDLTDGNGTQFQYLTQEEPFQKNVEYEKRLLKKLETAGRETERINFAEA